MKPAPLFAAVLGCTLAAAGPGRAADLDQLKVLYVGSERATEFVDFLTGKVARVEAKSRQAFQPRDAAAFDVVLLDWPQGEETREVRKLTAPLGPRDGWKTPTVLLGSAGLNLGVAWKVKGGSGCTCLDPLAYDLRDHEIFEKPFRIDRGRMVSIPTPAGFRGELRGAEIKVLPLVADRTKKWPAGWCTHALAFAKYPDVEFFCGGVNSQTPTSAALWRQGNLLHFGFELAPGEMTEAGRHLFLNAIAYISRFSEDRPIAVNPSVFAGPAARSRATVVRWLRNPEYPPEVVTEMLAPELRTRLASLTDRDRLVAWAEQNARFLYPDAAHKLALDADLVALGVAFDQPEFFDKALADLRSGERERVARARRLLARYVPGGPGEAAADVWARWWEENKAFAFASDDADYRWYVDPRAKQLGIPITECRGPVRADRR